MKICFKCQQEKSLDDFYPHAVMRDGHLNKCKECTKVDVRKNYAAHFERYREYDRNRSNLPHRIQGRLEYAQSVQGRTAQSRAKRKYIERNPIKRAAHILCGNAIRDGRLTPQPCEVCGSQLAQAHHDDYGKPLNVRWLCTVHHAEWHKHNTPICPDQADAA